MLLLSWRVPLLVRQAVAPTSHNRTLCKLSGPRAKTETQQRRRAARSHGYTATTPPEGAISRGSPNRWGIVNNPFLLLFSVLFYVL